MLKNYVCSGFRIMLLSFLIFQPIQAVDLFDQHPIVAGSVIAAPLPLAATSCAAMYSMSMMFLDMLYMLCSGKVVKETKIFVPFVVAPIVTAVIADAFINRTFSKSDSKKKAIHAAAATNGIMSLAPFLYAIATAPEPCSADKYLIASLGMGSLIGAAYMLYGYYKPVQKAEQDK